MLTPIACTLEGLAAGELRSSDLVESCLNAIANVAGEGKRTFTRTFDHTAPCGREEIRYRSRGSATRWFADFGERFV